MQLFDKPTDYEAFEREGGTHTMPAGKFHK